MAYFKKYKDSIILIVFIIKTKQILNINNFSANGFINMRKRIYAYIVDTIFLV